MKVIIGPYKSWIGHYQLADKLCWWAKPVKDECGFQTKPSWVHNFGTWLATNKDGSDSWITKTLAWIDSKRKRQVYVRIDKFDTWNMDDTLAYIILPMLKQLKRTKHGSPKVDDFDTPQHLWSTNADPKLNPHDTDSNWHKRWEYVIDEMIWAFQQHLDPHGDEQFYDYTNVDKTLPLLEQRPKFLEAEYNLYHHRKQNGFLLFGKYYQALWD